MAKNKKKFNLSSQNSTWTTAVEFAGRNFNSMFENDRFVLWPPKLSTKRRIFLPFSINSSFHASSQASKISAKKCVDQLNKILSLQVIQAFLFAVYSIGIICRLKHCGFLYLPIANKGRLSVPVALVQTNTEILFLLSFRPATISP